MNHTAKAPKKLEDCEQSLMLYRYDDRERTSPVRSSKDTGSRTILIVDDCPENRQVLVTLLGYVGHVLLEASDGEEALKVARAYRPDLIIADILMPKMDGYEFVRQLRGDSRISQTNVIFHSAAYNESEARTLADACGVSHILPKPASPDEVLTTVGKALGIKQVPVPIVSQEFDREHLRVVTDKLVQKAAELEQANARLTAINAGLEERVRGRTAELSRSNAELEQFAFVAAHDLQEPLRKVIAYTQLLAKQYVGKLDRDADEFMGYTVDGAARMQQLIHDLLAYSRAGKGIELVPVDSASALARSLLDLRGAVEESRAVVTFDALPTILGDESQLVHLFQNLIGNALKYRAADGIKRHLVHISAEVCGNESTFSIRDNGIGIDPQYAKRIFVIFQRLHSRTEYPGTGIGLAICRKIVECQGGRIWFDSQLGQGSTFYFTLPIPPCRLSAKTNDEVTND